jgi:hypothetical protein
MLLQSLLCLSLLGKPVDAAVVVGIADYFALPDIPGATDNATDWYTWLTTAKGLAPEHVALLRNTEATREDLMAAIDKATSQVSADGTLTFVSVIVLRTCKPMTASCWASMPSPRKQHHCTRGVAY